MRIRLKLSLTDRGRNILPINYQYELSSWIYKTINTGDPEFATWLHEKGYMNRQKQFKLFTFSNLDIPSRSVIKDRLIIHSENIFLTISLMPNEAAQGFIVGLFRDREFSLGDRQSQVHFQVENIESLPEPEFSGRMTFHSLSPILVSTKKPEERYVRYLSPEDDGYSQLLLANLKSKYSAFAGVQISDELVYFKCLTTPKRKCITIKAGTPEETQMIAYNYRFQIEANPELLRVGYYCGAGEKNSTGFGCVEIER